MFAQHIDGEVSRALNWLTRDARFTHHPVCLHWHGDSDLTRRASTTANSSPRIPRRLLSVGLDLIHRGAGLMGGLRERGNARVRWLELRNKIAAYRLFEGRDCTGHRAELETICSLDPYSRLFAAEGFVYRNVDRGAAMSDMPLELSLIAIHAGAGLRLAEQVLASIHAGESRSRMLNEFSAVCRQESSAGFGGIMEEALGLVTRTKHPHLLDGLDRHLRTMNGQSWERFWHGVGRGIYFAPSNVPPFRTAPWSGVGMCLSEPPHETGKRNALSGFCFALTLVNLGEPEVLEAFFQHHPTDLDCMDGMDAAMTVWTLSSRSSGAQERVPILATALTARGLGMTDEDWLRPERLFSVRQKARVFGCGDELGGQIARVPAGGA